MVQAADSNFLSNMPVVARDSKIQLPTKAATVPSCNG
jgi:hypothetical protein